MDFSNTDVWGFEHAIRGMRNPLESHIKSDSWLDKDGKVVIGPNDLALMKRLIRGGSEHRKFMRQIMVSVDISAALYYWKEFDTYKIGTTANSTSTMHRIMSRPITLSCFEFDDYNNYLELSTTNITHGGESSFTINDAWTDILSVCNMLRDKYLVTKDKRYWKELIRILPESWIQRRTVTMNYENLYSIVRQRKGHKLVEWERFINWVKTLPYADDLVFLDCIKENET